MSTIVRIPTPLRTLTGGQDEVTADGRTVGDLIENLEKKLPVQILELDRVLVGDDELAETRLGERDRCGRADTARSDEQHAKRAGRTIRRSTHRD